MGKIAHQRPHCFRPSIATLSIWENVIEPCAYSALVACSQSQLQAAKTIAGIAWTLLGIQLLLTKNKTPKNSENQKSQEWDWKKVTGLMLTCYGIGSLAQEAFLYLSLSRLTNPSKETHPELCDHFIELVKQQTLSCPLTQTIWNTLQKRGLSLRCAEPDPPLSPVLEREAAWFDNLSAIWHDKNLVVIPSPTLEPTAATYLLGALFFIEYTTDRSVQWIHSPCSYTSKEYLHIATTVLTGAIYSAQRIANQCVAHQFWPQGANGTQSYKELVLPEEMEQFVTKYRNEYLYDRLATHTLACNPQDWASLQKTKDAHLPGYQFNAYRFKTRQTTDEKPKNQAIVLHNNRILK